eukprot:1405433-Alexandrium_andersonii.AAC.1
MADEVELLPRGAPAAAESAASERRAHELSGHARYAAWCPHCIAGRGREQPRRRRDQAASDLPKILADYHFLTADAVQKEEQPGSLPVL